MVEGQDKLVLNLATCSERYMLNNVNSNPAAEGTYYGLNDLDRKLEKYLDFDDGKFVEAGANDGETQSNTCYFERSRGWKGVLIEPIPAQFLRCRKARPRSRTVWAAVAPPNWSDPFVELTYCNLMTVTHSPDTRVDLNIHVDLGRQFLAPDDETHTIFAPARTFSAILEEAALFDIDLFSLDVEGFEVAALQGLDLLRFRVKAFCIETSSLPDVMTVLGRGYEVVDQLTHHDYYIERRY